MQENISGNCKELAICSDKLIERVIGCAIETHRFTGPGLLESAYEKALLYELNLSKIRCRNQVEVPLIYKGSKVGTGFKADIIVNDELILELKSAGKISDLHLAQLITYLKMMNIKRGLIINFNTRLLKNGIKRVSI